MELSKQLAKNKKIKLLLLVASPSSEKLTHKLLYRRKTEKFVAPSTSMKGKKRRQDIASQNNRPPGLKCCAKENNKQTNTQPAKTAEEQVQITQRLRKLFSLVVRQNMFANNSINVFDIHVNFCTGNKINPNEYR